MRNDHESIKETYRYVIKMDDTHVYFEKYSKKTGKLLKKVSLKNEEADFITHWIDIWVG